MIASYDLFILVTFLLFAGHALADYHQGDWVAINKSRKNNPRDWYWLLFGHSLIHGAAVFIVLIGVALLVQGWPGGAADARAVLMVGIGEMILHAATDFRKCEGKIGFAGDQLVHYFTKVLWALIAVIGIF